MDEIEKLLLDLMDGEYTCVCLEFNLCHTWYQTVAEHEAEDPGTAWLNAEEKKLGIANDSIWTAQWYPHNAVQCKFLSASNLPVLLTALKKEKVKK